MHHASRLQSADICISWPKGSLISEPTLLVLGHAGHAAEMNTPSLQQPRLMNVASVLRSLHLFIVIHSIDYVMIHNIKFRILYNHQKYEHFYPSSKETPYLLWGYSQVPAPPNFPSPGNHSSTCCLYELAHFGDFIQMESYHRWLLIFGWTTSRHMFTAGSQIPPQD